MFYFNPVEEMQGMKNTEWGEGSFYTHDIRINYKA